jgi:small subunit ribosomal protein S6
VGDILGGDYVTPVLGEEWQRQEGDCMSLYELMVIAQVPVGDEAAEVRPLLEQVLSKHKGSVKNTDEWGERQLAFPIKKHDRGLYGVFEISLEPGKVRKVNQALKLDKRVVRHMLFKKA